MRGGAGRVFGNVGTFMRVTRTRPLSFAIGAYRYALWMFERKPPLPPRS